MITEQEKIEIELRELKNKSKALKDIHEWGNWENWREFINLDIKANELKMKMMELENKALYEALDAYKNY